MSVEELYPWMTAEDSIREKNWAAGSLKPSDNTAYIFTLRPDMLPSTDVSMLEKYVVVPKTLVYSQMLIKIVDEALVNASDHMIRMQNDRYPVRCIMLTFDRTGRISITNDGRGIQVVEHKQASAHCKHTVYLPEMFLGCAFQGTNRKKDEDSIIGGTNGLGGKITNIHSTEFTVDTVDPDRSLHYRQTWRDGMRTCLPPTITPLSQMPRDSSSSIHPHTTIEFMPNYASMGFELISGQLSDAAYDDMYNVLRTRMVHTAAYCHYGVKPKKNGLAIWFNNEILRFYSAADILTCMFPTAQICSGITTTPRIHPWDVAFCVTPSPKLSELSIVNGIVVQSGKHTKALMDELGACIEPRFKKLSDNEQKHVRKHMRDNMFLLVNCKIGNPEWQSQSKDVLVGDIKPFRAYKLPPKAIASFLNDVEISHDEEIGVSKVKKVKKVKYEKYTEAQYAGTNRSQECLLCVFEGDSAMNSARGGIAKNNLSNIVGLICSGGVPMNARRDSTVMRTNTGQHVKMSDQLAKNKFFEALIYNVGLNTSYRYDPAMPQYKKEMKQLRYGAIVAMVDQDLDGKGNILGSLLSTFHYWWPELLRAGFIKWYSTPIIRAYPKQGRILEFESQHAFEKWAQDSNDASKYSIKYYKGLGTHSNVEMAHMFSQFRKQLFTFTLDHAAAQSFHTYYGADPQKRKEVLVTPARLLTAAEEDIQLRTRMIPVTSHLEVETKAYQLDNLERKLDHVIDGLNQSGRKIVDGLIKAFANTHQPKKVAGLAGFITEKCNYHHGEASLSDTIARRGFLCQGGVQIPDPVPFGAFGTIIEGSEDASAPRYIFGGPNPIKPLLYRPEHYDLLPRTVEEGATYEPDYFTPIVPMVICEGSHMPAHGWQINTFPRDMSDVIANVRLLIALPDAKPRYMRPCRYAGAPYEYKGTFRMVGDIEYSVGSYEILHNPLRIHITALPLRVWVSPYLAAIEKLAADSAIIDADATIINKSGDTNVDLTIFLLEGALARIDEYSQPYFNGVEIYFRLRESMKPQINLMLDDAVLNLSAYAEVFQYWFPRVRKMYEESAARQRILACLRKDMYANITRYIRERLQMGTKTVAQMNTILSESLYLRFNKAHLEKPGSIPNADLRDHVLNTDATYMYLLQLSDFKKSDESLARYQALYDDMVAYIAKLDLENSPEFGAFPGAYRWLADLDEFEACFHEGMRTAWKFGFTSLTFSETASN